MRNLIKQYINAPQDLGIEIGPAYNPICSKKEGYNVKIVDRYTKDELIERYRRWDVSEHLLENIEDVDFLDLKGDLSVLDTYANSLDYIVSSHNFEHLANPVHFLRVCQNLLKPNGHIFLIIPDRRGTFDYLRPVSSIGSILEAWINGDKAPSFSEVFDFYLYHVTGNEIAGDTKLSHSPRQAYEMACKARSGEYIDCHTFTYTPKSFTSLIQCLNELDIVSFGIEELVAPWNFEFMAILSKNKSKVLQSINQNLIGVLYEHLNDMRKI